MMVPDRRGTVTQGGRTVNDEHKRLVQESFREIEPISDKAASLFYERLFELDPALRTLFKTDLQVQGRALMSMLRVAVLGLDHLEELVPAVQSLGRRHVSYGVKQDDYATVGQALLDTLQTGLGSGFTPEVREAWTEVYGLLAATMQESYGASAS
jgi:hemoglobin-like flavoprotein